MKKAVLPSLSFLILSAFFAGAARAQSPPALSVDDEIDRVQVSSPALSPDGEKVVYVQTELDWEENERKSRLFLVPPGGEPYPFTAGPSDTAPRWSPDGRFIAFLRSRGSEDGEGKDDKKTQIWIMPADGGEATPLTDLSEGVKQFVWGPASDRIVFSAPDPKSEQEKESLEKGDDAIYVFEGPNGQGRDRWSNLWQVELADRVSRQITHEPMVVSDFDVSPNGESVAFVYRRENVRNQDDRAEIAVASVATGTLRQLTENRAPESKVRFLPGGREVSYLAPDDGSWELRQPKLWILDVETREHRSASGAFEGDIADYVWSTDGKSVLLVAGVETNRWIFRLDPESGRAEPAFSAPGTVEDASFSRERQRAAFVRSDATTPPDVYLADLPAGTAARRLTDANPHLRDRALARVEVVSWKSEDGHPIEGLLYLPPEHRPGERVPLVVHIHGGPAGVFTNSWSADRHVLAGLGYASLCPNVRGSTAYGDDFLRANMNEIGGGDYRDLMSGVDWLIEQGIADPERMGVRGWSYGGILGGWVVTQTDRFRAASLGAMVSDWTSEYGQGFNYDVRLWYIGGDPWSNPEGYRALSPLTHVQNVSTPTLLLHGEEDTTCTVEQSMNFFNALWEKGLPTRFIRFPREEHGLREPRHLRTRLVEEIAWMQKYVRGIEWTDEREKAGETAQSTSPAPQPDRGSELRPPRSPRASGRAASPR